MALVLQASAWQIEEIGQVPRDDLNHFLGIGFVGATIRRGHEPYNVSGMPDRDRLTVWLKTGLTTSTYCEHVTVRTPDTQEF